MIIHSCLETMNMVASSFSNMDFLHTLFKERTTYLREISDISSDIFTWTDSKIVDTLLFVDTLSNQCDKKI